MTVVAPSEITRSGLTARTPSAPPTGIAPVAVRLHMARRRRLVAALRNLATVTGVTGLAVVLLAVTFFSLVGR